MTANETKGQIGDLVLSVYQIHEEVVKFCVEVAEENALSPRVAKRNEYHSQNQRNWAERQWKNPADTGCQRGSTNGGGRTPIELFLDGVRCLSGGIRRLIDDKESPAEK